MASNLYHFKSVHLLYMLIYNMHMCSILLTEQFPEVDGNLSQQGQVKSFNLRIRSAHQTLYRC